MKRITIAPEHKKFFQINGYISFEELVSSHETAALWKQIRKQQSELPGLFLENLSRSIPEVLVLARKLGGIAAGLLDRKPIRFAYDCFVENLEEIPEIDEREVGFLLSLSGKGFFFTDSSHLYNEKEECYLLIIFTANYVNNPIVYNDR